MRKFLVSIAVLLYLLGPVSAQTLMGLKAGSVARVSTAFSGLGDVTGNWKTAHSVTAFSAATRGNKLMNVCDNTGANCQDLFSSAITGKLVGATLVGGTVCPGPNCLVKIWYDISGGTNCGGSACDETQAVAALMPVLTANCTGTNPCVRFNGTTQGLANSTGFTLAQPNSVSWVANRTGNLTTASLIIDTAFHVFFGYDASTNTALISAGAAFDATASDNNLHAIQATANGASSEIYVDGVSTLGNPSGDFFQGNFFMGLNITGVQPCACDMMEVAINSVTFVGGVNALLNTNQHTRFGF